MVSILFALLAGVLTIAAPCTLPVLPILLGTSLGRSSRTRPLFIALGFVLSFAGIALAFSVFSHILGIDPDTLRNIAVGMLVVFGLLMLWPHLFEGLSAHLSARLNRHAWAVPGGHDGGTGFLLGAALGLVWTPCAGPVLGAILTTIATAEFGWGGVLLFCYALGAAIPMLAIAYGGQAVSTRVRSVARIAPLLQQGFGIVVIGFAAAMYWQYDTVLVAWFSGFYPNGRIGL